MTTQEFLVDFQDVLQRDEPVTADTVLGDLIEWDSLSKMATMAYFKSHFGMAISLNGFTDIKTVADLIALAGDKING